MRIENQELKKAIFGAVDIWEEDGMLKLCRFTQRQLVFFDETKNYVEKPMKSRASAGMRLDFYTDSRKLDLELSCFVASSQSLCYVDIYVDGFMKAHCGYMARENRCFQASADLGDGRKRVTVYFPCLFGTSIIHAQLDDGAEFTPAAAAEKLLFLGDSITQGYISEFPSLTYPNLLTRALDAECVNQGIGGAYFLEGDLDEALPYTPDRVFVAYGTNDWSHGYDVAGNADAHLQKLCRIYPQARIYVILPIWRGGIPAKEKTTAQTFCQMHEDLRRVCQKYESIRVLDGLELVPHYPEFFAADQLHPNALGFTVYAQMLEKAVAQADSTR